MQPNRLFIVCEIGMNHMGDCAYADEYVESLVAAKPDGVTFQIREPAGYARQSPGASTLLPDDYYLRAAKALKSAGVKLGIALCDRAKIPLCEEAGVDFYKILSKDLSNAELLAGVLATGKPTFVSTGMSDETQIAAMLEKFGAPQLSLIHTQLSHVDADANLRAIARMRERFGVPVGYGSHCTDSNVLYTALAFDPVAEFFYVRGPRPIVHKDQEHAIPLDQVPAIIASLRRLEVMLGDGVKHEMEKRIPSQRT